MVDPTLVDYDGLIPNNVGLNADPRLRRALENWHPGCIDWWKQRGPEGFQANLVYLRTAISVEPEGWARFGYVRMPEYRWGILLAPAIEDRRIGFGSTRTNRSGRKCPANTARCCAALSSCRAIPSPLQLSNSAISAAPPRRFTICATCSKSM